MESKRDPMFFDASVLAECVLTLNLKPKEDTRFIEQKEITSDFRGLFAKEDIKKWTVLGDFEPFSTFVPCKEVPKAYIPGAWADRIIREVGNDISRTLQFWKIQKELYPRNSDVDLVESLIEKLSKNAFRSGNRLLLFLTPSFFNHSCFPNVLHIDGAFLAMKNIKKGEELTLWYDSDPDTKKRHDRLFKLYGFECQTCTESTKLSPGKYCFELLCSDCVACGKNQEEIAACSRCRIAHYCSRTCQTQDWKKHKKICTKIRNEFHNASEEKLVCI